MSNGTSARLTYFRSGMPQGACRDQKSTDSHACPVLRQGQKRSMTSFYAKKEIINYKREYYNLTINLARIFSIRSRGRLPSYSNRREFLKMLCTGAASAAFPASISRAVAIQANNRTGTICDVEHIIFMMQENRSFDHYFGTLRGVRGFGDPRAVGLASGKSVFHQPHGDGHLLPFHPGAPNLGLQFLEDLPHDWTSTHRACNGGRYDQWVPNKGPTTMAYLTRSDIPYHYALADAFTVCDAYHCSLLGPTDPNRYHMWSGWIGNDGSGGGPVIGNGEEG